MKSKFTFVLFFYFFMSSYAFSQTVEIIPSKSGPFLAGEIVDYRFYTSMSNPNYLYSYHITGGRKVSGTAPNISIQWDTPGTGTIDLTCTVQYLPGSRCQAKYSVTILDGSVIPEVTSISGPSSLQLTGNEVRGSFSAYPSYHALQGTCRWSVTGASTYRIEASGFGAGIYFTAPGTYTVSARGYKNNVAVGNTISCNVNVYRSSSASIVYHNSSKVMQVIPEVEAPLDRDLTYQISSLTTGALKKKGIIPKNGGEVELSDLPSGLYVVNLISGGGVVMTEKISVK